MRKRRKPTLEQLRAKYFARVAKTQAEIRASRTYENVRINY